MKKANQPIANMEKVVIFWIDQISHNVFLNQSLIQSKIPILNSVKTERGEEAAEEKFECNS